MKIQSAIRSSTLSAAAVVALGGLGSGGSLAGQDFTPPQRASETPATQIGLFGFSARVGWDFKDDAKGVLGAALDLGHLGTQRLRLRPSVEIGFGDDVDTYVVNGELLYRFVDDTEIAVPYLGLGLGVAGQDGCDSASECPDLWLQFAVGFELRLRDNLNWLVEFHSLNALDRHRLFVGLASRRAP